MAYSPKELWAKAGNGAARDLRNAEGDATTLEDVFNLPRQLTQLLMDQKWIGLKNVLGRELYVVSERRESAEVKEYLEKEAACPAAAVLDQHAVRAVPDQITTATSAMSAAENCPSSGSISQVPRNRKFTWAMQNVRAMAVEDSKLAKPAPATAAR